MDPRVEQICVKLERPIEPRRERIDQQFGAIETVPVPRLEAAMGAQAVTGAGTKARDMPMKYVARPAWQLDPRGLSIGGVEERNEDGPGTARRDGKIHPRAVRCRAERLGMARGDARWQRGGGVQVITVGAWRPV